MTQITADSAWRQWKGAVRDHRTAELRLAESRSIWLRTLMEGFEERRREADAAGNDIASKDALIALGIPCVDCLAPAGKGAGHKIVNSRDEEAGYQTYATCGKKSIDPTAVPMPELYHATAD